MTTCNRCGKAVGTNDWDIHTCTPKPGWCDDCETVAHCLKYGCIPKVVAESNKAAYQRGYLDGMAKPCVECADRQWVDLTDEQRSAIIRHHSFAEDIIRVTAAKLKELNK